MLLLLLQCAEDGNVPMSSHVFESKEISLQHQGLDIDSEIKVNSRDCMEYITELANPDELLLDPLIVDQNDWWWQLANADRVVHLFDESTGGSVNYEPLVDLIHGKVAPHALHQQRRENHVQMAALTASTHDVGEGRRTDRSGALSYIMRPFNRDVVLEVKEHRACNTGAWKKKTIERVAGRQRVELYGKYCDTFNSRVEASRAAIGDERCQQVFSHVATDNNKVSRLDLDARKDRFAMGIDKQHKITKS